MLWAMSDRRPGEGRYAQVEREQRWLVASIPALLGPPVEIVDRYLVGTTLRLRTVDDGQRRIHKLCQKVRLDPGDPTMVKLTNLYLTAEEHAVLATLPAAVLVKVRSHLDVDGQVVAVDRFGGRLDGLVLAEVELAEEERPWPLPPFAERDVTHDDRFSGGSLAVADDAAVAALLAGAAD
jgi:CYTH domain-containing protein